MQNDKRATQGDSLFENWAVSIKPYTGTDGHIIHIDEVTKENRAEHYYCVGCGGEMSAVLGDKREHHFRHKEAHCSWESYLHNPRSCRTADFIFEKKGILGLYDLKTVSGKGSVGTQLLDSIGQTGAVGITTRHGTPRRRPGR